MQYYRPTTRLQKVRKLFQLFSQYFQAARRPPAIRNPNLGILMVVPQLDRTGGYERQALQLSESLAKAGKIVQIITDNPDGLTGREFRNGVLIRRLSGNKSINLFALTWRLLRGRNSFQILHAHGISGFSLYAVQLARILGRTAILKPATSGDISAIQNGSGAKCQVYRGWMRQADRYIAVSEEIGKELRDAKIPADKIVKISNFVNTGHFAPASAERKKILRSRFSVPDDAIVFLYLGRFEKRKGVEFLLKGWQSEGILWLVGDGIEQERLKSIALELKLVNCRFLGATDAPLDFYQAADVFVFPSLKEGAPNAVLEAMSCGLPVITTRIGGTVEFVRDHQEGLLVSPASPEELCAAMESAAHNLEERLRWGRQARVTACENFGIAEATAQYLNLYASSLKLRHSSSPGTSA